MNHVLTHWNTWQYVALANQEPLHEVVLSDMFSMNWHLVSPSLKSACQNHKPSLLSPSQSQFLLCPAKRYLAIRKCCLSFQLCSSLSRAYLIFVVLATAWVFKGDVPMILKLSFDVSLHSKICRGISNSLISPPSHSLISISFARFAVFWWQLQHNFHPQITLIPFCFSCSAISSVILF